MRIEDKVTTRYVIEFFNKRADWIGWNILRSSDGDVQHDNYYSMTTASEAYSNASKYMPEDIALRIVEVKRTVMALPEKEDE